MLQHLTSSSFPCQDRQMGAYRYSENGQDSEFCLPPIHGDPFQRTSLPLSDRMSQGKTAAPWQGASSSPGRHPTPNSYAAIRKRQQRSNWWDPKADKGQEMQKIKDMVRRSTLAKSESSGSLAEDAAQSRESLPSKSGSRDKINPFFYGPATVKLRQSDSQIPLPHRPKSHPSVFSAPAAEPTFTRSHQKRPPLSGDNENVQIPQHQQMRPNPPLQKKDVSQAHGIRLMRITTPPVDAPIPLPAEPESYLPSQTPSYNSIECQTIDQELSRPMLFELEKLKKTAAKQESWIKSIQRINDAVSVVLLAHAFI